MDRLPALYRSESVKEFNSGADLYRYTRFAFLACVRRNVHEGEDWLIEKTSPKRLFVAIPLHEIDHSSYTRTTFNGHTLHLFEDDGYFNHRLPITSFDPVWIRRAGYAKDEYVNWPLSVKHVSFSLSCRDPAPLKTVTYPMCMDIEISSGDVQGTEVDESTWSGQEDLKPPRVCTRGTLATDELRHQVIAIHNTSVGSAVDTCYTVLCFGMADRHLWMCSLTGMKYEELSSIAEYVRFPAGRFWRQPNSTFCIFPN